MPNRKSSVASYFLDSIYYGAPVFFPFGLYRNCKQTATCHLFVFIQGSFCASPGNPCSMHNCLPNAELNTRTQQVAFMANHRV
jgi:hypothetical protein